MFNSIFQTYYFEVNSFSIETLLVVVLLAIVIMFLVEIIRLLIKVSVSLTQIASQNSINPVEIEKKLDETK